MKHNVSSAWLISQLPSRVLSKIEKLVSDGKRIKLNKVNSELVPRFASFPFISGDTFRSICSLTFDENDPVPDISELSNLMVRENVFCSLVFLEQVGAAQLLALWYKKSFRNVSGKATLILHNGDKVPSKEVFSLLRHAGWRIFSVNVLDSAEGPIPLPIGLENLYLDTNGQLHDYIKFKDEKVSQHNIEDRTISIFSSFNTMTNPEERNLLKSLVLKSRHNHYDERLNPSEFRNLVAKSLFVLSPPGNGADCHRTWESIYLGAIPVVKRGYLAESITNGSPILVVENWSDVLDLPEAKLRSLYIKLISRSPRKAFANYWLKKF